MRKRKRLEVSTFPFLAVLLCTMGSLILLLLVIDKKAKKAALEKAYEAAWNSSQEKQAKNELIKTEFENEKTTWIKNKTNIHEQLAKQENLLEKEIADLKKQLLELDKSMELTKSHQLSEDIKKKVTVLEKSKNKILSLETKFEETKTNTEKTAKETKSLSDQIVSMELILKELKASTEKEKYSFSIVPYFGKSGLNRRPLYIECTEAGIIFFPDKTLIPTSDESDQVKELVRNRIAQLRVYLEQSLGPKNSTPYMMILVRPDGISNYWKLQSVIKSMDVDYGYELVDKSWTLDIPVELSSPSPKNLASMIIPNGSTNKFPRPIPAPGNIRGGINNGNGSIPQTDNPTNGSGESSLDFPEKNKGEGNSKTISYGATATNIKPLTSLPGFTQNNGSLNNNSNNKGANANSNETSNNKNPSNISNNSVPGNNSGENSSANGNNTENRNGINKYNSGNNPNNNLENNNPGNKNSTNPSNSVIKNNFQGNSDNNPSTQKNDAGSTKNNLGQNSGGTNGGTSGIDNSTQNDGISGSNGKYSVQTTPNSFPSDNNTNKKNNNPGSVGTDKTDTNSKSGEGTPSEQSAKTNSPNNSDSNQKQTPNLGQGMPETGQPSTPSLSLSINNKEKTELKETAKQSPPRTTYNKDDDFQKETETQDPTAKVAVPLPELGPRKTKPPAPLRPARLFADRDWVIYVECKFEEIMVHPNRLVIPTNLLASEEGIIRFVQEIEKMIKRKQSTVRPGEPPYRPEVRYLVWPDGLRAYHLSYPALQLAGIKQKRQSLEREDSIREIIQGR